MDFRRLSYFCAIVEHGSISGAARQLNISQPPLSLRLKELEDELGLPLIIRTKGRWEVTDAGQNLYQRSQQVLKQLDKIAQDVREFSENTSGRFSIAVTYAAYYYFLPFFAKILKNYSKVNAKLLVADDDRVEKSLQNCTSDIGITLAPLKYNNYKTITLGYRGYVVVFPKSLGLPERDELSPEDLAGIPLMLMARWEGIPIKNIAIRNAFRKLDIEPEIILETADPHHIIDVLRLGVRAAGIIHESYLSKEESKELCWRKFYFPEVSDELILIWRDDAYISNLLKKVIDCLTAQ